MSESVDDAGEERRAPVPAMLAGCDDRLTPDPMITEVPFTRFVLPGISFPGPGGYGTHGLVAVLPRAVINLAPVQAVARLAPDMTWREAQGGVAPIEEWNAPDLDAPVAPQVLVDNVNELIARRELLLEDRPLRIDLTPGDIDALLNGAVAVVPTLAAEGDEPRLVRLVPREGGDGPARSSVLVSDLVRFLADPRLPTGPGGEPGEALSITSEHVSALRTDGRARSRRRAERSRWSSKALTSPERAARRLALRSPGREARLPTASGPLALTRFHRRWLGSW